MLAVLEVFCVQSKFAFFIHKFTTSQPECGWLTRSRLSCRIWKLIMQLPQPAFANWKESSVERVVRHVMLSMGLIRRSSSFMASSIVCVAKKDGGVRIACDYRYLNTLSEMYFRWQRISYNLT